MLAIVADAPTTVITGIPVVVAIMVDADNTHTD